MLIRIHIYKLTVPIANDLAMYRIVDCIGSYVYIEITEQ